MVYVGLNTGLCSGVHVCLQRGTQGHGVVIEG